MSLRRKIFRIDSDSLCQFLECLKVFWSAIRITAVVYRIGPNEDVITVGDFCISQGVAKEDGVTSRDVSRGNF